MFDVGLMRVQDRANIIPATDEIALARESEALEKATTDELVVVTVPTLNRADITAYSAALGNKFGLGQADKDNGVLVVVAPKERQVRVSVGNGLEGLLTNQRAAVVVRDMVPLFRNGDAPRAIKTGVREIDAILRSDVRRPQYLKKAA